MTTLGQKIRELREKKDFSLRELAKEISVTAPFLSDIELGRRYPSDKVLSLIANKLDISIEELKEYDTRAPIEDLKRLVNSDPGFSFAFRKVIDKKISSEELLDFVEKIRKKK